MNLSGQRTIENIKKQGLPVIIFGARSVGEALFYACHEAGIKVECFCDNNINRTKNPVCCIEVIHTSDLKKRYQKAIFLISAADIKDVAEQLQNLGFPKWYPCTLLLRNFNVYQYQFSFPQDFVRYTVDTCILCHDSFSNPEKIFLRSVDIIITERCSLKCKDCSNLTQYYKNPKDCDINDLIKSIDEFCNLVDEVNEFRVIGAEPFMNLDFNVVANRLVNEPKVRKIVIYTNGTIVPPDNKLESLKNDKVLLIITDYGPLSRNLDALTQKLSSNNIAFYVQKPQVWTDCSKIVKHNRNTEEQKEIFKNCCAKNTFTISDGKFYRCPFAANAARLKAVPDCQDDYIDFFRDLQKGIDISELKKKIKNYIWNKVFLSACDFCNGRSFDDFEITPAIQTNKPLEYEEYN